LFINPLAGDIRRHRDERYHKQNRKYKKQLFGHSNSLGVAERPDVTLRGDIRQKKTKSGRFAAPWSGRFA
jgi:hypothetical protein